MCRVAEVAQFLILGLCLYENRHRVQSNMFHIISKPQYKEGKTLKI